MDGDSGQTTVSDVAYTLEESGQFTGLEPDSILQAVVFLEDAYQYRSINHKIHPKDLQIYRIYQSKGVYVFRFFVIFVLHILAFFEFPSSLTITSDLQSQKSRIEMPCWLNQAIELICLFSLLLDNIIKIYLMGVHYFVRHKWDLCSMAVLAISIIDWAVSFGMGCQEFIRFRRLFRPLFIFQHSSLMKKIVNCLRLTMPEIASVLLLLFLHLFIFTLFGMLIFPDVIIPPSHRNKTVPVPPLVGNATPSNIVDLHPSEYFTGFVQSFINLLVLMTTANNPDITMPVYSKNRFSSLFFILYLLIGLYCFMNILLAVIYNQFRGYFLSSMQRDLLRRRLGVRASFEVLRRKQQVMPDGSHMSVCIVGIGVGGHVIKKVVEDSQLPIQVKEAVKQGLQGSLNKLLTVKQYQQLFYCLDKEVFHEQRPGISWCVNPTLRRMQKVLVHRYFLFFGILVSFINLIIIMVSLLTRFDNDLWKDHAILQLVNFIFILYYMLEQLLKLWAFGWRLYFFHKGNAFDAVVTIALVIAEISLAIYDGLPFLQQPEMSDQTVALWNVIRIINIFIMIRILRIVPHNKAMSLVLSVLVDLVKNMKAFAGVLVVIFYAFAIMGMELFHGVIEYKPEYVNRTFDCGSYEQLNYWANNFDDFFSSLVVLWDVMVVNNWQVFLNVFKEKTTPWSYLFFIAWWLVSVIIMMNLFTALIMEKFIVKWDRRNQQQQQMSMSVSSHRIVSVHLNDDVHAMFRDLLEEPADNDLLKILNNHHFLHLER